METEYFLKLIETCTLASLCGRYGGFTNIGKNVLTLTLLYNLGLNWVLNPPGDNNIYEESKAGMALCNSNVTPT